MMMMMMMRRRRRRRRRRIADRGSQKPIHEAKLFGDDRPAFA
jgi:hypothetical protein